MTVPAFCFDNGRPVVRSSGSTGVTGLFSCALQRWDRRGSVRDSGKFHAPHSALPVCVPFGSCDCVGDNRATETFSLSRVNPGSRAIKGLREGDFRDSAR